MYAGSTRVPGWSAGEAGAGAAAAELHCRRRWRSYFAAAGLRCGRRSWGASRGRLQAPAAAHGRVDSRPSAPAASVRGATAVLSSIGESNLRPVHKSRSSS